MGESGKIIARSAMKQVSTDFRPVSNLPTAAAMVAWLGVQLAALGICAARFPLWARAPRATEQLALFAMLAAQTAAASLLFPILLRNIRSTLIAIVVAWPMAELASFLADASTDRLIGTELFVSVWLVTLHLYSRSLNNSRDKLMATAVAGMLSLGGPLLWYLRMEFGEAGVSSARLGLFGPVCGAISLAAGVDSPFIAWGELIILFAIALTIFFAKKKNPIILSTGYPQI